MTGSSQPPARERCECSACHPSCQQLVGEAPLLREAQHDRVVGTRFEQGLDDLLAPLKRAVGRRAGARCFELRAGRQQVDAAIRVELAAFRRHRRHRSGRRRLRIDHDEQVERIHGLLHFQPARLRVGRVAPVKDGRRFGPWPIDSLGSSTASIQRLTVVPGLVIIASEAKRFFSQSRSTFQTLASAPKSPARCRSSRAASPVRTDVSRALDVVVATEDVGATAGDTDVAEHELQQARSAHDGVADRVLGLPHAPDDRAGTVLGHRLGGQQHLVFGHAAGFGHPCRGSTS